MDQRENGRRFGLSRGNKEAQKTVQNESRRNEDVIWGFH